METRRRSLNPLTDALLTAESDSRQHQSRVAASVCAYASEFFDPDARVLDNFCGSGTMLYDAGFYPHHSPHGRGYQHDGSGSRQGKQPVCACPSAVPLHRLPQIHSKNMTKSLSICPLGCGWATTPGMNETYGSYLRFCLKYLTDEGLAVLYTHEKHLTENLM